MTQMENMLEKVLKLTEKGKLKWSTTVNPQAFLTVLGRQSVVISKHTAGGWEDDSTPDDEFLGPHVNARLGWQPAFDKENGDLYSGIRNETVIQDPLPSSRLLSIFKISR